ncbi:Zinc/iron permease [Pterulicium gracile]|uniref:Zinc/iron permease n=1 Tax=Pterulicium gracile TaxID=1884261 RepID=A0A5C3QNW1_9AGAR|nr:Zinc/iron permease [Pterula gracilis]
MGLRIGSIFIIFVTSLLATTFPIMANAVSWLKVPDALFDFAKYFGSGVIISTAFIHLLAHGLGALSSECLSDAWREYPWGLTICMLSIFLLFIIELVAFRWGTSRLAKLGITHDAHGHGVGGGHSAHGPEAGSVTNDKTKTVDGSSSSVTSHSLEYTAMMDREGATAQQIVGVGILEFGVLLHSVLIGLTLAVTEDYTVLFVVILFHQTFEGMGLGARLAHLRLPKSYRAIPLAAALVYALATPIGIAAGLGVRSTYNSGSTTSSIVMGVMDCFSAGILLYTGLVELLAHEFLFNKEMLHASNGRLAYAITCMCLGCAMMSLLGKWA